MVYIIVHFETKEIKQKFSNQKKFYIKKMHEGILSFCKDFVSIYLNFTKLDVKNYFLNLKNAKLDNAKNPKKKLTDFITLVTVESS